MNIRLVALMLAAPALVSGQKNADWPLYGGTTDNTRHSTLGQISPAAFERRTAVA